MTGPGLALLGVLATFAFAAHLLLRPHAYLGKGTAPVTDPRVIRGFGVFLLLLGASVAFLIFYQFVSE